MKRGRTMRPEDFEQFQTTINLWFGLKIADATEVAQRVGCSDGIISIMRTGSGRTTYKMAGYVMEAIGQIEAKYIAKWQQERARQRLGGRVVETYGAGRKHESY